MAQRLGILINSLAKWVSEARIDRGDFGSSDQGQITSEERAEPKRLGKKSRELLRDK